ncbi:hypothetical protein HZA97_08975 [Candidatus Woesearchaeota archaeon]|nr:hypothetical protein [Candidatus Woesearchaeota archaeon]
MTELDFLKDLGMTDGEIKTYHALFRLGRTTTGALIKEAGISASKIYIILDKLAKKGLVNYTIKNKTKYFQANDPIKIINLIEDKEKELEKQKKKTQDIIPQLRFSLERKEELKAPIVLEGLEGLKYLLNQIYEDLDKDDEFLGMGITADRPEPINRIFKHFNTETRPKKGIKMRLIFSEKPKEYFKKYPLTQMRILPGITPAAISIDKKRVVIYNSWEPLSMTVIYNPEVIKSFQTFFESLWKIAK